MKRKIIISCAVVIVFLIFSFRKSPPRSDQGQSTPPLQGGEGIAPRLMEEGVGGGDYVVLGGKKVSVEVADTPLKQQRGLSDRKSLEEDAGMLFVFAVPGKYPFWMKDMNFPIDIIWIDQDLKVAYIQKDARPESYPEAFGGNVIAKYVLEVSAGFSDKNNLKVGDGVVLE